MDLNALCKFFIKYNVFLILPDLKHKTMKNDSFHFALILLAKLFNQSIQKVNLKFL